MEKGPQLGDKIMFNFHLKPPLFITGLWHFAFGQLLQFIIYLQTKNRSVWNKSALKRRFKLSLQSRWFLHMNLIYKLRVTTKRLLLKRKGYHKIGFLRKFQSWYFPYSLWNEVDLGEGPEGKYAISRLNPEPYLHKICRVINFSVPNVLSQTVTHTLNYVQLHCPYAEMRDAYSQSDWRILFCSTMLLTG